MKRSEGYTVRLLGSVVEYICEHAKNTPDKTAVIGIDSTWTYKQLWHNITAAAKLLSDKGISRGKKVMLEAGHTCEFVALLYAIHLAGAASVSLEHAIPLDRVNEIAEEINPALILLGEHPLSQLDGATLDDLPEISEQNWTFPEKDMLQEILFTTGTTGKSKGVLISHGAYVNRSISRISALNIREDNVWLIPTPMNHAAGLMRMSLSMTHGDTVVLINGFTNLKLFFEKIRSCHVKSLYIPPSGIHYILTLASSKLAEFDGQLDLITSSSAVLPRGDREKMNQLLPHVSKMNAYGSSETGPICFLDYNADNKDTRCVGKPYPGIEVFIVDEEGNRITSSADNPGIIAVKSKCLFSGYLNEPELSAQTIHGDVMYLTDMGYFEDGYLYLIGRRDDVINVGGLKVAPGEVEDAALQNPAIDECACVPYEDKMYEKAIKLFVKVKPGCQLGVEDMYKYLEAKLERYKIPRRIVLIDEIPRLYNGKIDRKKLIEM